MRIRTHQASDGVWRRGAAQRPTRRSCARPSRGGHPLTTEAQRLYNIRERDAYRSFVATHGPIKGGQKGFRRVLKEHGWVTPNRGRVPTPERAEKERAFVEEGLGRSGHYTRHRYPLLAEE
jgi:hypothetical protein